VYIYIYTYLTVYICVCTCVCIRRYTWMSLRRCICISVIIFYMYAMPVCLCACVCVWSYTYIHAYVYTHIKKRLFGFNGRIGRIVQVPILNKWTTKKGNCFSCQTFEHHMRIGPMSMHRSSIHLQLIWVTTWVITIPSLVLPLFRYLSFTAAFSHIG